MVTEQPECLYSYVGGVRCESYDIRKMQTQRVSAAASRSRC